MTITIEPTFPTHLNTHILHGAPFPALLSRYLTTSSPPRKRAYIVVSTALSKSHPETVQSLRDALGPLLVGERIGITSHSPWNEIIEIAQDAAEKKPDIFITLGGGSYTDGLKIVTLLLANLSSFSIATMSSLQSSPPSSWTPATIPLVCIPTTLSAGEYTSIAGAVDPRSGHKTAFIHPSLSPAAVLLDPALSRFTPEWIWLSTGVRAVDHCVETLLSRNELTEGQREWAERGLRRLVRGLLKTKEDGEDVDARLETMLGARDSIRGVVEGVELGVSHGIGHQLGAMGVPHGVTSCVMLPTVMRWNAREERERERQNVVEKVVREVSGLEEGEGLGGVLRKVFDRLGMKRGLKEVGVGRERWEELAQMAMGDFWTVTNPRAVKGTEDVLEILNMVEEEDPCNLAN